MVDCLIPLLIGGKAQFEIVLDSDNSNEAFMLGHFQRGLCYEVEIVQIMVRAIQSGDFCLDVGANVGFFTMLMSRLVGDTGKVIAVEPDKENLRKLVANLERNKITNVEVIAQPAWSKDEQIRFWLNADSTGSHCVWDPGTFALNTQSRLHPESYMMSAVKLDHWVDAPIKFIKIDTEGAEQRILEGLEKALQQYHPPLVVVEFNPHGAKQLNCSGNSMRSYMAQFGYDTFLLNVDGDLPALVPPKTEITHERDMVVMNGLFATIDTIAEYWPRVPFP